MCDVHGLEQLQNVCGSLTVERCANIKSSKESLAEKKYIFFLLYSFLIPSMLSCNPSVFCMAPADYSTYQRTQDSIRRITSSFFDGYTANVVIKSFEGILLSFHTHYKNLLDELPFFIEL